MIKNRAKKAVKPARRARTKIKKPKYLSLRHQLSSEKPTQNQSLDDQQMLSPATNHHHHHRQLNLFPLHPENSDTHDHENMAYFFSSADGGDTTLTGLLSSSTTSSSDHEDNVTANCTTLSSSVSLGYPYGTRDGGEEVALVRTALRNKERDASEERWVCYSEVVERRSEEEVTSCAVDDQRIKLQRLALKLDYQEILNAWSDRGSLFIHAELPQTVPDIYDDFSPHQTPQGLQDGWERNVGVWTVPEMKSKDAKCGIRSEEEGQVSEDQLKSSGQREASVLRYKEKRQNRLFAKRIRYEVRKLNAEKRPRVKGRFVKRS